MDIDVGLAVSNAWNKAKPLVFVFSTSKSLPSTPYAVEAKKIGGKSGAELAKMAGLGDLKPQQDLIVRVVKLPIDKDAIGKPVKKGGVPLYPLGKTAKTDVVGVLRADEKHKPGYVRKKPSDPLVWQVKDKRSPEFDPKKMLQILQQGTLDAWAKKSRQIARIIEANRPDGHGKQGYFTLASAVKGKTPKQLESLLGFKSGTFKDGAHVFVAKTAQLSISNVDFKGYTNTIGGISSSDMSAAEIKKALEKYAFGGGVVQINVTKPINVKKVTGKAPLGYTDKVKF